MISPAETPSSGKADEEMGLIRPPVLRPSTILNKALFTKRVNLAAASIRDNKNIDKFRKALGNNKDLLHLERLSPIAPDPDANLAAKGKKCLLLKRAISIKSPETWGPVVEELVKQDGIRLVPYELKLDYDYWTYRDVLWSLLPEDLMDDIPQGFNQTGHVAHFNLRKQHLPYKNLIGQVVLEKTSTIRTAINKIENVGTDSEFRTFNYEILAGSDDMDVEVNETGCTFKFNYAKVYWNSKLEHEHRRLIDLFQPGEVVCDVMAGVGPFAIPAGKRGVFVWANDYNPESYKYLVGNIDDNKVTQYVRPFNEDGRVFIKRAADAVLAASKDNECVIVHPKQRFSRSDPHKKRPDPKRIPIPPTISHFVMNLPASATEFLPCYRGLYAGEEHLFAPHTETKLPLVHVHCFAVKSDDDVPRIDICQRLSKELGVTMRFGGDDPMSVKDGEAFIHHVRDVAPAKSMFCASFRLPAEVAFAPGT